MIFKIISMLVILGVLSVLPMIYTGKLDPVAFINNGGTGKQTSEIAALKAQAPENLSTAVTDKKVQIYRWRDENGVMQFSNTPPPSVKGAEQVVLDPNSNLMQAVKQPQVEPEPVVQAESPSPYSVKGMKKVMEDAKAVETLLQQRHEQQQKMMSDL
jgi:hypothetical protein